MRNRYFHYMVIKAGDKFYLKQRGPKDVWQGLFDFYLVETATEASTEAVMNELPAAFLEKAIIADESKVYKHILTHQRIFATFYLLELQSQSAVPMPEGLSAYSVDQIKEHPKTILIQKYLEEVIF